MIELLGSAVSSVFVPIAYIVLASLAGQWVSWSVPWRKDIRETNIPFATGIAIAPFLIGLTSVALLALPFEKSITFFVYMPLVVLAVPAALGLRRGSSAKPVSAKQLLGLRLLYALWALWAAMLIFNATLYVLTQNDALEYAMVGRLLFETGSLAEYPAISPEVSKDGFYGPWTHPPLYVAMVAQANFLQGHADHPGLMRLIAPWFLLVATYATWAIGSLVNRRVGALSALILISAPLLFLGADSALLDSITVASFVLLMAVLLGLDYSPDGAKKRDLLRSGATLGAVIGLGMWAHSQTILYLPVGLFLLALMTGIKPSRGYWHIASAALLTALIVGSPPYLRNLATMGTLISDEPAVFALDVLDWRGYFDFARGLDHPTAIIQYGLFKGWFSMEAYGLSYWFMTLGLVFVIADKRFTLREILHPATLRTDPAAFLLWTACALFLCYFGGTLLSILLGMNLMIKNERYLLTTLPAVGVIGAYGLERLSVTLAKHVQNSGKGWRDTVLASLLAAEVFALSSFLIVGFYYRFRLLPPENSSEINWDEANQSLFEVGNASFLGKEFDPDRAFHSFPSIQSIEFMNAALPEDALVLAARPADFYYLDRKMVSYLDLRMLDVYEEDDPATAVQKLQEIGITHIHMVDYALPPFYNSALSTILTDPELSELVYDNTFFQLYALRASEKRVTDYIDFGPEPGENGQKWATRTRFVLGGRKALSATGGEFELLDETGLSQKDFPLFHRDYTTFLMPTTLNSNGLRIPLFFNIIPGQEYIVEFDVHGHGFLRFWAEIYSDDDGVLRSGNENPRMRIYEAVLNDTYPQQTVTRRFKAAPWAEKVVFQIEHLGKSTVRIDGARLLSLAP